MSLSGPFASHTLCVAEETYTHTGAIATYSALAMHKLFGSSEQVYNVRAIFFKLLARKLSPREVKGHFYLGLQSVLSDAAEF